MSSPKFLPGKIASRVDRIRRTAEFDLALLLVVLLTAGQFTSALTISWLHGLGLVIVLLFLPHPTAETTLRKRVQWQAAILIAVCLGSHFLLGNAWSAHLWLLTWPVFSCLGRVSWTISFSQLAATCRSRLQKLPGLAERGQLDGLLINLLLPGTLLYIGGHFWPQTFPPLYWALFALPLDIALRVWTSTKRQPPPGTRTRSQYLLTLATWCAPLLLWLAMTRPPFARAHLVFVLAATILLWIHRRSSQRLHALGVSAVGENYRWGFLILGSLWLLNGFSTVYLQGTGDALWYGTMLADAVTQARAHVFPLFVGQSEYQFNGAIYPLRIAPAFHYAGTLLDALTLRSLGIFALQNLLITLVGCATVFVGYVSLCTLAKNHRWLAAILSLLFLACPGVLGVAYNTDLYMSWMTLPWLILALATAARTFQAPDIRVFITLGAATGILWWGHSPIALWATFVIGVTQIVRLCVAQNISRDWKSLLAAALLFGLIASYPVGSVLLYPPEAGVNAAGFQKASVENITYFVRSAFPRSMLPLSSNARELGDFQIGYALIALFGWALWQRRRGTSLLIDTLLVASAGFLLLLLPIPHLNEQAWKLVPGFVRDTTSNWAMNRLYVLLAACLTTAAALLAVQPPKAPADHTRQSPRWLYVLLIAACLWSLREGYKFSAIARLYQPNPTSHVDLLRPENIRVPSFSYLVFPALTPYFSHGVVDPQLEHRLLTQDQQALLVENTQPALRNATVRQTVRLMRPGASDDPTIWNAASPLILQPAKHYLAKFAFARPELSPGVLQLIGPTLFREYQLPAYGESRSFGSGGQHTNLLPLSTSSTQPETVQLRIITPVNPDYAQDAFLAQVELWEYDPVTLPVQVMSWIPYRLKVTSPAAGWLETPRMFQQGYIASLGQGPAKVSKTPNNLVGVAIPAGQSIVELRWQAPTGLLLLFWVSALTILSWLTWAVCLWIRESASLVRPCLHPEPSPKDSPATGPMPL